MTSLGKLPFKLLRCLVGGAVLVVPEEPYLEAGV